MTMVVVSVVDLFNGFGPPDKGGSFTSGVDKLDNVKLQLEAAVVDPRDWDGDAAKAYTAQLAALQALVETMKDLDKQMQALVANQGAEVQKAHTAISVTLFALVVAQGIALVLYMIPIVGAEISCAWQIVAAFAACATVLAFEMFTLANSMSLGHEINALALEYGDVQKNATLSAAFARIEVAAAQQSTFTSFTAISESMAGMSAFANMPTVSSLARMAGTAGEGAAADAQAKMTALEEPPADGIPEGTPGVPDTGAAPAFTPPTLAQVSAASGQAAKMSGHISQHMNLVNQTMGSVQQVSSMGQQGQQAAAPAEDAAAEGAAPAEAALADDAEGAGAGINTDGAERAPVDLAGGGQSGTSQSERFV
ncbi:hypothetical protein AWC20_19410 [Mycobacterium parmense]|nr:hypothetical protein AWC20_19410 [Mycobacterium parmense]